MTLPKSICRQCGREDGHWLGCDNSPRPGEIVVNAFEPLPPEATCAEDDCAEPIVNGRSKYCTVHGTSVAYNARGYRKRTTKKEE